MGVGEQIACFTCKKLYYLGYGSYGTWFYATNLKEWQECAERTPDHATLLKNQNLLEVVLEHDGHDLRQWPDDYEYGQEGDTLYAMGAWATRGDPIIEHVSEFEYVSMDYDSRVKYGPHREVA